MIGRVFDVLEVGACLVIVRPLVEGLALRVLHMKAYPLGFGCTLEYSIRIAWRRGAK